MCVWGGGGGGGGEGENRRLFFFFKYENYIFSVVLMSLLSMS